jgi:hypothetical protein
VKEKQLNRIGQVNFNNYNSRMTIIEYLNTDNISVQFDNGYINKTTYRNFKNGKVRNPYDKTVYEIGYIGEGKFKTQGTVYTAWCNMIKRCYSNYNTHKNRKSYSICTVDEQWYNFQNFAQWWEDNYYKINEVLHIDKDILIHNNKIYSPNTCLLVPATINELFVKVNKRTLKNLPIGVGITNRGINKYVGSFTINGKKQSKCFPTKEESFIFYKNNKESYIKIIAEKYKNKIPEKVYRALINYKVQMYDNTVEYN